jgi:hypothetical protein
MTWLVAFVNTDMCDDASYPQKRCVLTSWWCAGENAPMTQDSIMQLRIATSYREMLDELRRHEADIPSRSEMIRRLIERAAGDQKKLAAKVVAG